MSPRASLLLAVVLLLASCGSESIWREFPHGLPLGTTSANADTSMLFMGNSHASVNDLQGLVVHMVYSAQPTKSVAAVEAPGWMFLEDRPGHEPSMTLLQGQDWSFVVLQAQKYSTTGCCTYSTAEAKALIRMARVQHAVPIMFPEWPRRGVNETMRIYDLHVSIAQEEPACVAPIGQAFDLALSRYPGLVLHADDGNHSSPAGAFLAALVLMATITGTSPLDVPAFFVYGVDAATQEVLRVAADDTVQAWPPRTWCPNDPY